MCSCFSISISSSMVAVVVAIVTARVGVVDVVVAIKAEVVGAIDIVIVVVKV